MDLDESVASVSVAVTDMAFATYEEYLDSQITPLDMFYLEVQIALI